VSRGAGGGSNLDYIEQVWCLWWAWSRSISVTIPETWRLQLGVVDREMFFLAKL
jgi:hypothetical protein